MSMPSGLSLPGQLSSYQKLKLNELVYTLWAQMPLDVEVDMIRTIASSP